MTTNEKTIIKFYTAFNNGDASTMRECYHPKIQFRDPVFNLLKEKELIGENIKEVKEQNKKEEKDN